MKSCCCELDDVAYYQGETKSGEKWTPAFIEYVDKEKCNGCGMCIKVCSRGVYGIQELNGRKISVAVNADNCVEMEVAIWYASLKRWYAYQREYRNISSSG